MLGWSQQELATRAGITRKTLAGVERGGGRGFASTVAAAVSALEAGGIRFVDIEGDPAVVLAGDRSGRD